MYVKRLVHWVLVLAIVLPAAAFAQDAGPVTWVSFVKAKPGVSPALTQHIVKAGTPTYDPLMAAGQVLQWGVAQPINHYPDQAYSHAEYVVFANWDAVNAFVTTFLGNMAAMSEEDRTAQQAAYQELVVPGSHFDIVNRGVHFGGTSKGRPGYLHLGFFKVKPGADFMDLYKKFAVPVFEKASADGAIGQFGMDVQELHGGDHAWTHMVWYESSGLGARDAVEAIFQEMEAARSDDENAAMAAMMEEVFVPDTHRDEIVAIVHHAAAGGGDGGE